MKSLIYIFLGGGMGSVLRFLVSHYTQKRWHFHSFPVGTFLVNMLGCFFIGIFSGYFVKIDHQLKYFLIAGFCGGFTTFSTFSLENYSLLQNGDYFALFLYILLSILLGLAAVFLGLECTK